MIKRRLIKGVALASILAAGIFTPQLAKSLNKSLIKEEGDNIVLFQYDPSESEADVFRDVGGFRVLIGRDALKGLDFSSVRTEPLG